MAIGRITGPMLFSNLERQGVNLAIDANLVYADVSNRRVGISTATPQYTLDVNGNAHLGNLYVINNTITSDTGKINLGSTANLIISGGSIYNVLYTDGAGDVAFASLTTLATLGGFTGNNIAVGSTPKGNDGFGTNALTTGMNVADAINTLDNILGNITNSSGNVITTGNLYLNGVTGYNISNGVLITDGTGATSFVNANSIPAIVSINSNTNAINANITAVNVAIAALNANTNVEGNTIVLGANTVAALTSNAVSLTQTTKVTDAIAQLNYVLGKLVPPAPPTFPGGSTLSLTSSTTTALMTNFVQTDNSGWGNLSVSGGTSVSAVRASTYTAGTITSVGPGDSGTVTAYLNGKSAGSVTLNGSSNGTYSNLVIASNQDYHNVVSTVTAGFWYSFNASLSGASVSAGWNRANIADSATGSSTNTITWYYDNSTPGTPTFSNTSVTLTSNSTTYSSTIPHFNSSTTFKIKGNVANLSGDMYLASPFGVSAGGAFATPTTPTYSSFSPTVTTPLTRNFLTSSYFETPVSITTGFGSSSTGPTVTFNNSYGTGTSSAIGPGVTVLYKTGTTTQIEETAITNSYTGGSAAYRIVNPDAGTAADTPAYTGSEATFNSQTGTFYATDATVVASVLKYDTTNYSTGYLPVGPNLSTRGAGAQYFTFKFVKSAVSKFNISYSGTIAGLWVALPGSTIDTTAAPTNGWINMATAYAGSGVPGTGTGGNGSSGCSTGGAAVLNSLVSNGSYTCTFGTASSTNSTGNEIYVRVKLTSGQSLTALSIANPTN
jgi:hypothetical protein